MRGAARTKRYWLPLVAAAICLTVAFYVGPLIAMILMIAALGLVFDAATAWFAKVSGTGGLRDYKQ
jgi:hypothetical protein